MPRMRSGAIVAVAAIAVLAAACSSGGGSSAIKTATNVAGAGGMDALVAAAKAEGTLNVIALPARLGELRRDDRRRSRPSTASRSTRQQPDANSQEEIDAVNSQHGHGQRARRARPRRQRRPGEHRTCSRRTRSRPGPTSRRTSRKPTGLWVSDYAGFMSIGCDAGKVPLPATVADLLKPEYEGQGRAQRQPDDRGRRLERRRHGLAGQRRLGGRHRARRRVLQAAQRGGQPAAGRPDPGHDRVRPDAVRHRLGVQQRGAQTGGPGDGRASTGRSSIPSDAAAGRRPTTSRRSTRTRPHPAAARLWQEYLYSPEGQNTWLKGFARPVLQDKMVADGTIDQEALGQARQAVRHASGR